MIARIASLFLALVTASGCTMMDTNFGLSKTPLTMDRAAIAASPYRVATINIDVPRSLTVSEANAYFPRADIVWREDPRGDRHAQVEKILRDGLTQGAANLRGPRRVVVDVRLQRFHALSEKARYTYGGIHNIVFSMRVRAAGSGEVIEDWRVINAEFSASGADAAIAEDRRGLTQKVLIQSRLAQVIQYELSH